ncbi:ABC-2 type transport system ATP-binding protein [Sinosporangium album]|uniref:ABC-2 type transport system ATP-binding protein n=1 Tax=Sinosporangium album TaxID=504805 RepID=A0A1G7V403_9ACTN|nr:ABC transporter ATP-binding protein [Sinosporangium album]SDG54503.1 ABC-2 type transport system ATP-binding protein [Sinosporangium album]
MSGLLVEAPGSGQDLAIEVGGLHQRYGNFEAVRGISFTVQRGELFALLGTNGAGKTTTMEVLEGFTRPGDGHVRVFGLDPWKDRRKIRPRIGILHQDAGFLGDLTVQETVTLWRGMSADAGRATIDNALALVGLESKAKVKVRQLSGGQKRRLDLALAVLSRPDLLFLDEPTTGMDPEARFATWKVIQDLKAQGATVLLTTHYLEEAERLADRLAIMHEGSIHTYGTVDEVVSGAGDQVAFRLPMSAAQAKERFAEGLPFVQGIAPIVTYTAGGTQVVYTLSEGSEAARAQAAVRSLLAWADGVGVTLERLEIRRGTLEDVFMRVVGEVR